MTEAAVTLTVNTRAGAVQGLREGEVAAFHGVPYAAPPVGRLRFAAPVPPEPWSGVRDATKPGPSAPQNGSRLDAVMGITHFSQSEDCLNLDIWTPASDAGKRPVLVWLHGGAYMSGGGSQPFYTGGRLAAKGDMVVVSVTYRIGALGYLLVEGRGDEGCAAANRGLLDQARALAWIAENIAAFGGDPGNVTVTGQSAGAGSVLALMCHDGAEGLFHKAVLQSAPGLNHTLEEGREVARSFYRHAGLADGDVAALRTLDVKQILAAQHAVVVEQSAKPIRMIPWQPVTGQPELPVMPSEAVAHGAQPQIPVMAGWTRNEMHAWYAQAPGLVAATSVEALRAFPPGAMVPPEDLPMLEQAVAAGAEPWEALSAYHTLSVFGDVAKSICDARASRGCDAYLYRFDWVPTRNARFLACHCIEIPFLFDNFADWPPSPMLEGADPAALVRVTTAVQSAWISFAHTGLPRVDGVEGWTPRGQGKTLMVFDDPAHISV